MEKSEHFASAPGGGIPIIWGKTGRDIFTADLDFEEDFRRAALKNRV